MTEARDLDRPRRRSEELACAETVADRSGAHARSVRRHLQERVERHDLVDLAPPDVHMVGERVGQLHRDRAHLAPDAAEIVEKSCSGAGELRKQRCKPEHVHHFRVYSAAGCLRSAFVPRPASLTLEPPLARGSRRCRRHTPARYGQCGAELLDEPLDRELAVACLTALVLGDGSEHGPGACDDPPLLRVRESARGLHVEQGLHPRRRLLCMLTARSTRSRDA